MELEKLLQRIRATSYTYQDDLPEGIALEPFLDDKSVDLISLSFFDILDGNSEGFLGQTHEKDPGVWFGSLFYTKLFEVAPEARPLFKAAQHAQAKKLTVMLAAAIRLAVDPPQLVNKLKKLARKHVGHGVVITQYAAVGEALLWSLETASGDKWSSQMADAWWNAYSLMVHVMVPEASKAAKDSSLQQWLQDGEEGEKQREAGNKDSSKKNEDILDDASEASEPFTVPPEEQDLEESGPGSEAPGTGSLAKTWPSGTARWKEPRVEDEEEEGDDELVRQGCTGTAGRLEVDTISGDSPNTHTEASSEAQHEGAISETASPVNAGPGLGVSNACMAG